MATLYDLELQESNNMIHMIMGNGESPALKLMREQITMAEGMGEMGVQMLTELKDPTTEMGKSVARLEQMEKEMQVVMQTNNITKELAAKANAIFSKNPASLQDLNDDERSCIKDYWVRKKECILMMTQKGFTYEELFT